MSRNIYYNQQFTNSLGQIVSQYVWSRDMEKQIYPEGLTPYYEPINEAPMVSKMTVSQIQADRKIRSSKHFQKEILPSLGNDEKQHHTNKSK